MSGCQVTRQIQGLLLKTTSQPRSTPEMDTQSAPHPGATPEAGLLLPPKQREGYGPWQRPWLRARLPPSRPLSPSAPHTSPTTQGQAEQLTGSRLNTAGES